MFDPIDKKVIVSRDVQVDETWDWKKEATQDKEKGESLSVAPIITPTTQKVSDDEEEPSQPRMRSLQDLYDSTNELVCLLADSEDISFEEAVRDKKWQGAMDEEMNERNGTWWSYQIDP